MITDIEMEAMNTLRDSCNSDSVKEIMDVMIDMLGSLDTDMFYLMSDKNKEAFFKAYADKINERFDYLIDKGIEADKNTDDNKQLQVFTYDTARTDIIEYLSGQDEMYFSERAVMKGDVLRSETLINKLAQEHYRCVTCYGMEREWSCKDACDHDPGIVKAHLQNVSLNNKLYHIASKKKKKENHVLKQGMKR